MSHRPAIAIIAHRGVTYTGFPENSLPGFRAAVEEGYEGVELDVRLSKDKEVVVFHDIRLERLTKDGRGMVRTKTLDQLRTLRLKSQMVDTGIPTLKEALELFRHTRMMINIEIKSEMPMRGRIEERVLDLIHRAGLARQIVISSFNPLVINKVQKLDSHIRTGFIYEKRLPNFNQRLARGLIVDSWHPNFKGVTGRVLERARQAGCRLYPWTVNLEKDILRMIELGVDGVITDCPHLARTLLHNHHVQVKP
jgi:glycerophosphoryl diester phosphodiesterase